MTNKEIFKQCETEEGCLKYIKNSVAANKGYYNWTYLPSKEVPILDRLLAEGKVNKSISNSVEVWQIV